MVRLFTKLVACLAVQAAGAYVHPSMVTITNDIRRHQEAPVPTPPIHGLDRRQTDGAGRTYTRTIAPDSVCGYLSASPGNDIVCENGERCNWVKANGLNAVFCGISKNFLPTKLVAVSSVPGTDITAAKTDGAAPYCRTYAYPEGIRDYRCASTPVTVAQSADFTYEGQVGRSFETTVVSNIARTTEESQSDSTPATASSRTGTTPISTSDSLNSSNESKGSSVPVGAIVGGVVGGVALIALIAVAIFFFRKRSTRKRNSPAENIDGGYPSVQQVYPEPDQQVYPLPSPRSELDGSKSGMISPVQSTDYGRPDSSAYDGQTVSDMHRPYSPEAQSSFQQPVAYEMDQGNSHNRGQVHEMG
ncbi:conserved hypothetical protein [Verticillium alfalfae VaMs.102]|uniref:Uncharacterized protein n=1 Tax=Verticillium alfalfae (strain VaMs.102 / ATCC MYA-4576 / FGSC 10136) TaxID=526221 RepID=C9S963_VERA1|nr:conserved hypothetical protein [Verticillium alfalfae VaMs.102]EEY14111.1 conserved hypothetical protein [Verticillium alfalfae VaMs.102]